MLVIDKLAGLSQSNCYYIFIDFFFTLDEMKTLLNTRKSLMLRFLLRSIIIHKLRILYFNTNTCWRSWNQKVKFIKYTGYVIVLTIKGQLLFF